MNARTISSILLMLTIAPAAGAVPLGTAFTYQGQLQEGGTPPSGSCDFQFKLFDAPSSASPPAGGNMVGSDQVITNVAVTDGVFAVLLNDTGQFGPTAFAGENRWLQIGVTCPSTGSQIFTALSPRQALTAAPYALYAPAAGLASSVTCTGCVNATALAGGAVGPTKIAAGAAGQVLTTTGPGTVAWQAPSATGDITAVSAGSGLTGGGSSGAVQLSASFGGNGGASTVARSDHDHSGQTWTTANLTGLRIELTTGSPDSRALHGQSPAGTGVLGETNTGTGVSGVSKKGAGVFGQTNSAGDILAVAGVQGLGNCADCVGVSGKVAADAGVHARGVDGESLQGIGVQGYSASGAGVFGFSGLNGIGVRARAGRGSGLDAHSETGIGVLGASDEGPGVYGSSTTDTGVVAASDSGPGLTTVSGSGVALVATGTSANLIEAYKSGRPSVRKFYVSNTGEVFAAGAFHANGADVAEVVPTSDHLEAGDVVEIDPLHSGQFRRASTANSTGVAGVVSTRPGLALREADAPGVADDAPQLALVGRVPVKVSAEHGPIRPGDLLVAGATPGRAMRAPEHPAVGSVVGKALGALPSGIGTMQMLVMLR